MSRALRAAIRAVAAACAFRTMSRPSAGFISNQSPSLSLTTFCTNDFASVLPSLVFVWPSNCGSDSFTEMIAVRPSRMSSPETRSSRFLMRPQVSPQRLTVFVSAARKPSSWVPPSWVLMVLANVWTLSLNEVFHCIATSRPMCWLGACASTAMTVGWMTSLVPMRYVT